MSQDVQPAAAETPATDPAGPRRGVPVDWIAVAVGAVFAVLAAVRVLPAIPWDTVTIPLIK
ncbi:hypothetical protein [Hamadaea tsunoensis]|uniref:hypothetical protein n=1 Tax=Hamadaea tsunoensis TaxID=53368 RepID=UPI00054DB834|nr:hypothetical protein [Hamadaea tsunoensis]